MATVIPVLGEMHQIAAPGEKSGIDRLIILGGLPDGDLYKREVWEADNGDVFFYHQPTSFDGLKFNLRATKFISVRGGFLQVVGTVVYLSPSEWGVLEATEKDLGLLPVRGPLIVTPPPPEPTVPIGGKTYPLRHELRALGGHWDAAIKSWVVPQSKEFEARGLVARGPLQAPPAKSPSPSRYSGRGTILDPGLKVDPNDAARFASGPRRNMREGSCYKCGTLISAKGGFLLRDPQNRWVVECLPENQASCNERAFDDSLLDDDSAPQDPREVALEKEDVPF